MSETGFFPLSLVFRSSPGGSSSSSDSTLSTFLRLFSSCRFLIFDFLSFLSPCFHSVPFARSLFLYFCLPPNLRGSVSVWRRAPAGPWRHPDPAGCRVLQVRTPAPPGCSNLHQVGSPSRAPSRPPYQCPRWSNRVVLCRRVQPLCPRTAPPTPPGKIPSLRTTLDKGALVLR